MDNHTISLRQPGELRQHTPATILCWNCSKPIDGTAGLTLCMDCVRSTSKLTVDIPREAHAQFCRNCERFLVPPQTWVVAEPESRELLALLLKKIPSLTSKSSGVRLVDAGFVWTEPHSKRIKVNVVVQGEAQAGAGVILEERFVIEFVVVNTQCPDCARSYTVHQWRAAVQLRQKVAHKRTFLYLEQLMLRHNAHAETISIKESRDGIDFFFSQPNHALKLIDFLQNVAPIRQQRSEQLISTDTHSGTSQYKFSHSVEIAPISREDLVVLPRALAAKMGQIGRLVLCMRVNSSLQFMDPETLQSADLPGNIYWREPFPSLATVKELQPFVVLDSEPLGPMRGRWVLADVTVAREADMSQTFTVRSHLGAFLTPGDTVLGYYLGDVVFNSDLWDELAPGTQPDVVLVKKYFPRKHRTRVFRLKRMAAEREDEMDVDGGSRRTDRAGEANDYDDFLAELEEDPELRQGVNLYKDYDGLNARAADPSAEEGPTIDISELLDDLTID